MLNAYKTRGRGRIETPVDHIQAIHSKNRLSLDILKPKIDLRKIFKVSPLANERRKIDMIIQQQ